jgi:hypothetical protein
MPVTQLASFAQGPQSPSILTSNTPVTAVGYIPSVFNGLLTNYIQRTFNPISNFSYTNSIDSFGFLDAPITADAVYIIFPQTTPTTLQLDNLKNFVEGGGTLIVCGEFSPNFDAVNGRVSAILSHIGSTISVLQNVNPINDPTINATPGGVSEIIEIGNFDITSGISTVVTGSFGALQIDPSSSEAILITSENLINNIAMARERVGSGNVISFADVEMLNAANSNLFSNIVIQSKLNIAAASNPAPTPTPPSSSGGGDSPGPVQVVAVDRTPIDPAPAGTNIQPTDADGDGLREVITASDGATVDGNRDGIPDVQQTQVAGLRLINDGAAGSDYGALAVPDGIQLQAVTLSTAEADGSIPVTTVGGGTVVTTTPEGITNAFAGVISFNAAGVTPGGTTTATISFPTGLPAGTGNAYLRFNYSTNRFEEFVDANGNPLYTFIDSDGDGTVDGVSLTLTDGDPNWDGDGVANGTVVDPGFFGSGERIITGTKRGDRLIGNVLANTLNGKKGNDWLVGDLGNDILKGSRGKDGLFGGEGADLITGGKDRDRIYYTDASESSVDQRDTVKFGKKDRFVFSSFDGDSVTEGQQKLTFIGKSTFSSVAGELRATRSVLEADLNGDSIADFAINLRGNTLISSSNLVL